MTFPGASGAEEQRVFTPSDERGRGQIKPVEQAVGAARKFIGDQTRVERARITGGRLIRLGCFPLWPRSSSHSRAALAADALR